MLSLSNAQARKFLLLKHGLLGDHRFCGKTGALDFVRQAGCIQFDPVDACGKNAELTLFSRVKGFKKSDLAELLYDDRALVDYPDKNLSIIPTEDWPYFSRYREAARRGGEQFEGLAELESFAKDYIAAHGPVSSDELPVGGSIRWHSSIHWSGNWGGMSGAARSVLEQLYSTGELVIHRKSGTRKFYDLASRHIPQELLSAPDPFPDDFEHRKRRVLRRIGAVGLLWNRPSDAWLNIWGLDSEQRARAFSELCAEGRILEAQVEGFSAPLYLRAEDLPDAELAMSENRFRPRAEFLAPLDCMLWDRKLIRKLFGFDYSWEIYTPADKRKYGYYVLPILYGESFCGRIEAVAARADGGARVLTVRNIWYESGVKVTKTMRCAVDGAVKRLAAFNDCVSIARLDAPGPGANTERP